MNKPIRIQRKRIKGFNLQAQSPDGRPVVSVCRPGKWGNPFKVNCNTSPAQAVRLFSVALQTVQLDEELTADEFVRFAWMQSNAEQLRGKHLACFCALDAPCHADVLLELANA